MKTSTKAKSTAVPAAPPAAHNGFSLISNEKLLRLYAGMLKCRMIEERAAALLSGDGAPRGFQAAIGHEASAVGVLLDLLPEDIVAPSSRNPMAGILKGAPQESLLRPLTAASALAPTPLQNPPDGADPLHLALGAALACKTENKGKIAVALVHPVAAGPRSLDRFLQVAATHRLPLLFVRLSEWSGTPASRTMQAREEEIARETQACGVPRIAVDANDVVAVYRVATEAITQARKGYGPTLIDCVSIPSTDLDPIRGMEAYLTRKGLFKRRLRREIAETFARELDDAFRAAGVPLRSGGTFPVAAG